MRYSILGGLIGIVSTLLSATPGLGAERIAFYYPPFGEFTISTDDIETYANSGKVTDDFAFYINRVPSAQRAQFQQLLKTNFKLSPTLVSQVTYSQLGESVVRRLSELITTQTGQGSFYALRASLILSAATNPKGLNIVDVIRRYPSHTIRLNLTEQVIPFTWLTTQNKYLALIDNGTHFSTSEKLNDSDKIVIIRRLATHYVTDLTDRFISHFCYIHCRIGAFVTPSEPEPNLRFYILLSTQHSALSTVLSTMLMHRIVLLR